MMTGVDAVPVGSTPSDRPPDAYGEPAVRALFGHKNQSGDRSPPAPPSLPDHASRWADALLVAELLALDPVGLGGVHLQSSPGPLREAWLRHLEQTTPLRRLPSHADDSRLIGGLDLTATLNEGRPILQKGLLAELDGHILMCPMAERLPRRTVSHLTHALDSREVQIERDGLSHRHASRFALVAIDESDAWREEAPIEAALSERLAFKLHLHDIDWRLAAIDDLSLGPAPSDAADQSNGAAYDADLGGNESAQDREAARASLPDITIPDEVVAAFVQAAVALGIASLRAPWWAVQTARALAALRGLSSPGQEEVVDAARLVLGPRATRMPSAADESLESAAESEAADDTQPPEQATAPQPEDLPPSSFEPLRDQVPDAPADQEQGQPPPEPGPYHEDPPIQDLSVAAVAAALPAGLLALMAQHQGLSAGRRGRSANDPSRAGERQKTGSRGRPIGVRPGSPEQGHRLSLIDTLRQAAPWQSLRRNLHTPHDSKPSGHPLERRVSNSARPSLPPQDGAPRTRLLISREDLRIVARQPRRPSTTLFVVDASGSNALNRLAEAKGAVETMLADCYVRRDRVAVLGFRGQSAETLLPPTRSLVRAKRSLAGLPGGGGTPMARALVEARLLCESLSRRGETVSLVLLTDGKSNINLEGKPGREQAHADAIAASRELFATGVRCLLVDTSPKPQAQARELALAMGARYIPLPQARTGEIGRIVRNSLAA